jgi:hypothetical protein
MKEAPGSSETSVLTRATRRNNPEDTILNIRECYVEEAGSGSSPTRDMVLIVFNTGIVMSMENVK